MQDQGKAKPTTITLERNDEPVVEHPPGWHAHQGDAGPVLAEDQRKDHGVVLGPLVHDAPGVAEVAVVVVVVAGVAVVEAGAEAVVVEALAADDARSIKK